MKSVPIRVCFTLFSLILFAGCAISRSDFAYLNPGERYPEKTSHQPIYLSTLGLDDQRFEEIGYIHVSTKSRSGAYEELNHKLRDRARNVGADAVIHVTYGTENAFSISPFIVSFPYNVTTAQGLAVKRK
ncbi:MAG: hypothetical protein HYZ85_03710 [Candidatus Omnitrophica bacterium]|nr:hypothetical protein [Candidatus Omnitrophota bacterium]